MAIMSRANAVLRFTVVLFTLVDASYEESKNEIAEDICFIEAFHPKCLKNEVILMKSATYGRMRIGRCLTADEISDLQRVNIEDTKSYLGCSADVLPILDRKCSGNKECEVRVSDISAEGTKPCLSGLVVYLEVSYSCISVVDEERSCTVSAHNNRPIHILGSSASQGICGTESQPWHIEAPVGQRINVVLLNFASASTPQGVVHGEQSCRKYGSIVDRIGKRNTTICGDDAQREVKIYSSTGNAIYIIFNSHERSQEIHAVKFVLMTAAIGCSDIIPPEDTWLKRNKDAILIGCYSSRQTWHLNCQDGKWIGVIGNCSHSEREVVSLDASGHSGAESTFSNIELVLAIVAIIGFTAAICIAVVCIGAICLRRFKDKRGEEFKTRNYQINTVRSQQSDLRVSLNANENEWRASDVLHMPLYYPVNDGDKEFNLVNDTTMEDTGNPNYHR